MNNSLKSRRRFVSAAAAGTMALRKACNGATTAAGANARIRMGVVGVGGMGTGHVGGLVRRAHEDNVAVIAVCDVYRRRVSRAEKISGGRGYLDYRRVLDRNDIDAILIATPDHWHAKIAIEALESGKHVYVEKPMTHTIPQAIALRDAVRRTKKVLQVGPQGTGDDGFWQASAALRAGRIGKVTWAHGCYNRNARVCLFNAHQRIDPTAGPTKSGDDFIDWDQWLGHRWGLAPKIAWTPEHFFRFRKYWPYNGGVATDLLYHKLAPMLIALAGANGEYPLRVNAAGGLYVEKDGRDIPDTFLMTADYPGEFSIFLASTLTNDAGIPDRIYGKHGTMDLGGAPLLRFNGEFKDEFKRANEGKEELRLTVRQRRDQVGNFLDVVRDGGALHCNAELGCATMVAIKMAVDSYRQRRSLTWNPTTESVIA